MPKRTIGELDWGEDASRLQSKIHVGVKEINQGICASSNMKAVYNRTLSLLFQGSRGKACQQPVEPVPSAHLPHTQTSSKYSQMIFTSDGKLTTGANGQGSHQGTIVSPCQCRLCTSTGPLDQCRFCEDFFCESCFKACCVCRGGYCPKCSFTIYTGDESSICHTCASQRGSL